MIKRNLWKALVSSLVILVPILFGLIFRDSLPDVMGTHFAPDGTADGYSGKLFAILFIPLFLLLLHWTCLIVTDIDNRRNGQSGKVLGMVFWICPVISLYASAIIYATALGLEINIMAFLSILLGIIFIVTGNYMPKCKKNRTIGIKISWTLASEANWNATHRFGGKVWFFGGFIIMLGAFLPIEAVLFVLLPTTLIVSFLPVIYSYVYHRGELRRGEITKADLKMKKRDGVSLTVSLILLAVILTFCLLLCFSGDVSVSLGDDALTVDSSFYGSLSLSYSDIDSIEYREDGDLGARKMGFGTPRLSLGTFECAEFGSYTRYTYTAPSAHIVILSGEKTLVIGLEDDSKTEALYEELTKKAGK